MNKFSRKYIIIYGLLATVIFSMVLGQFILAKSKAENEIKQTLNNYSAITEEAVNSSLENVATTLYNVAYEVHQKPSFNKKYSKEDLIARKVPLKPINTIELSILDENAAVLQSTAEISGQKINLAEQDFFKFLKNNADTTPFLSEPTSGLFGNKWSVVLARRLTDSTGKFSGIAMASIKMDFFDQVREKFELGPLGFYMLVSAGKEMKILSRYPERDELIGAAVAPLGSEVAVYSGEKSSDVIEVMSPLEHVLRLNSIRHLGKYPLVVIIGRDIGEFRSSWMLQNLPFVIFTALVIIAGFFILLKFIKTSEQVSENQAQLAKSAKFVALGEMANSVAHEINNPMTIILGNVQRIQRYVSENSTDFPKYSASLEKIYQTVLRISKIVQGLRVFSGPIKQEMSVISLQFVFDEVLSISKEKFSGHGIRLDLTIEPLDLKIFGNETQIMQVFINLLNNSYDAINMFSDKWVSIRCYQEGDKVLISLTDSGRGLPPYVIERLMEPFFTTKPIGKGTGLGLSMAKGIIEGHRGKLTYDARRENTCFVVELPSVESRPVDKFLTAIA